LSPFIKPDIFRIFVYRRTLEWPMNKSMEDLSPSPAPAPRDTQFQVSLLHLVYPDSKISTQLAQLEQMLAPAKANQTPS
jgi:hypothetical protein